MARSSARRPRLQSHAVRGAALIGVVGIILLMSGWGIKESVVESDSPKEKSKTFAIVAASSSNHFKSFLRFCRRIASLVKDEDMQLITYDLGLTDKEHSEMSGEEFGKELSSLGLQRPMDFRTFDYSQYPAHYDVNVAKGEYAWKSAIIWEVLQDYEKIIWIDAGTNINEHISNMTLWSEMKDRISEDGVWCGVSSQSVKDWTHPGTLKYFNISDNDPILRKGNFAATIIGVDSKFPGAVDRIIKPWYECARVKECIAPAGSSRNNHRQDQAALTMIMHLNDWKPRGISCKGCGWGLPKFFQLWQEAEKGFN